MGDYISNIEQLFFPNGNRFSGYIDSNLSTKEKETALLGLITESETWVNIQLEGKTATPASHITAACKQIALEYARFLILRDNYVFDKNEREVVSNTYLKNAEKLVKALRYGSSASVPEASVQNTGDGTMSIITCDDAYTFTESWVVRCSSDPSIWSIFGSVHGQLYDLDTTDNNGTYPYQADSDKRLEAMRAIQFTITDGAVDFAEDDEFTFRTFAPSWKRALTGIKISRG